MTYTFDKKMKRMIVRNKPEIKGVIAYCMQEIDKQSKNKENRLEFEQIASWVAPQIASSMLGAFSNIFNGNLEGSNKRDRRRKVD